MKKSLYLFLVLAVLLAGCKGAPESHGSESVPEQSGYVTAEQSAPETAENSDNETTEHSRETAPETGEQESAPDGIPYIDENGLLTQQARERITAVAEEQGKGNTADYVGLFDFDRDEVPEVYFVRHNAGQGLMPVDVFSLDGAELGSFEGYCRDGFCRLSYDEDEDCVYVHNSYEHSMHIKHDSVYRLTIEDGKINSELYLLSSGAAGDNFPLLEFNYTVNGEDVEEEDYFFAYNSWLCDSADYMAREANEVSICAADSRNAPGDMSGMSEWAAELYNEYISGKNTIREQLGETWEGWNGHIFNVPMTYAFDDYDGDGSYEAFVVKDRNGEMYFLKDGELTEFGKTNMGAEYTSKYGGMLFVQGIGNSTPCHIYGVSEGAAYEHDMSYYGMLLRPHESRSRMDIENGIFVLYRSTYDGLNWGDSNTGAHTWLPYPFGFNETDNSWGELPSIPVNREYFAERADVQAAFDEIEAEGGEITTAFLRGDRYLNINYTTPLSEFDRDEPPEFPRENHYKTFIIQNQVTQIDKGRGVYYASINS